MNEKKQSGKKRLFLLVLVAFGIVLWITFTNLNRIALRHTLDETIGFVKIRLEQYETDAANDRVKSLVRLLDKTVSLGNEMTLKEGFGTQDLDSFAEEQRLTGALVLDENLNVVMQTTKGSSAMPLWEKLIDSPYVHNIVDYPKKTYSTRLEENGILYDFAAVARADAPGILITYIQKDNEDIGDLTVDSLLKDFPLELSGIATITENGRVISSNSSKQVNKAIEDCQELYNGTCCGGWHCAPERQSGRLVRQPGKYRELCALCVFPGISGVHDAQHCLCILSGHSRNGLFNGIAVADQNGKRRAAAASKTYRNYHSAWHGVYVHFTGGLEEKHR